MCQKHNLLIVFLRFLLCVVQTLGCVVAVCLKKITQGICKIKFFVFFNLHVSCFDVCALLELTANVL